MNRGDYVLATKYSDGDPGDQFCVGFYDRALPRSTGEVRHMVTDGEGKQFRGNGFRRCEPISHDVGVWLVARFEQFEPLHLETIDGEDRLVGKSVWDWRDEAVTASSS